ncbi:conserved hypothetical protein [Perkinsus marinus ATCC 50983]|uniref:Uncharacterized protein n=1 Tax=Perkinsus marinus (strain ATCC 50983 / TXsc) TaxID=423536 RepID=C5LPE9_PERM5|nr:conserved hypothetical protein [Perkinsus marinus ATCC 50983]EER01411.1 conserved hypothetical protein [Perkinsus marinus ATCC 50983]|eukprot:XP_002768693.1 conserved hypothetical protein [Perkinsus marinus ATCC 50983]
MPLRGQREAGRVVGFDVKGRRWWCVRDSEMGLRVWKEDRNGEVELAVWEGALLPAIAGSLEDEILRIKSELNRKVTDIKLNRHREGGGAKKRKRDDDGQVKKLQKIASGPLTGTSGPIRCLNCHQLVLARNLKDLAEHVDQEVKAAERRGRRLAMKEKQEAMAAARYAEALAQAPGRRERKRVDYTSKAFDQQINRALKRSEHPEEVEDDDEEDHVSGGRSRSARRESQNLSRVEGDGDYLESGDEDIRASDVDDEEEEEEEEVDNDGGIAADVKREHQQREVVVKQGKSIGTEIDEFEEFEPFYEREPTLPPMRTGMDNVTQVDEKYVYDFDGQEVQREIIDVIVNKTMQQALEEVREEEEQVAIADFQQRWHERQKAEREKYERLEAIEVERNERTQELIREADAKVRARQLLERKIEIGRFANKFSERVIAETLAELNAIGRFDNLLLNAAEQTPEAALLRVFMLDPQHVEGEKIPVGPIGIDSSTRLVDVLYRIQRWIAEHEPGVLAEATALLSPLQLATTPLLELYITTTGELVKSTEELFESSFMGKIAVRKKIRRQSLNRDQEESE